ncbi:peptidase T [candidate division KSB1 bacterium]|nr:peptidase T [candidate division KSB1 bacterium]RQW00305.1 MAG: peptidase T [candidate division KSB1 bacterium]
MDDYQYSCVDRFLRYVTYDTQSDPDSETFPSTDKQKKLAAVLVDELKNLGLVDTHMDDNGYVFATLPGNTGTKTPTIGLIAHMDTSPDVSGKDVKPIIHRNYRGGDIKLGESGVIIKMEDTPDLHNQIGHDIITADGTTLLGADNKAGIAEIFDAIKYFVENPNVKHGTIKIGITPDEEVGKGADFFDVQKFAADYAYTIDGESVGEVEDETFCADTVVLAINGINVHPGYAKDKMINSIKIASHIVEQLPKHTLSPETTKGREGYVHPHSIVGNEEKTVVKFLIRDFTVDGLKEKENFLREICHDVLTHYPRASFDFEVIEYYRNMKYKLDEDNRVVNSALQAVERAGLTPKKHAIRGGTDGARLSYMGLLTPNIFAGGHNFHSRQEYISIQDMQKAVDVIIHLIQIWEEQSR